MRAAFLVPAALQALAMVVDEGWFHRKRDLPRWERLGHPIDTASVALCFGWLVVSRPDQSNALTVYIALAAISCLLVTKDEFVHARLCSAGEQWVHSILFLLHPIVFASFGFLWWNGVDRRVLVGQLALTLAFMVYQLFYWSFSWNRSVTRDQ